MNIVERLNQEVSLYKLFDLAETPVTYATDKKPCQISCPFHGKDNRPSARVYPDTNTFRCFFCSKSWAPVTFWAEANGWYTDSGKLDLGRAISDLCDRFNISDQTFDWQKKFYQIKKLAESEPSISNEERIALHDYYSWSVVDVIRGLDAAGRASVKDVVISMWERLDSIDLFGETWETDLKNWYEDAKIMVDGQGL